MKIRNILLIVGSVALASPGQARPLTQQRQQYLEQSRQQKLQVIRQAAAGNPVEHATALVGYRTSKARAGWLKVKQLRRSGENARANRLSRALRSYQSRTTTLTRQLRALPKARSTPSAKIIDAWTKLTSSVMGLAHTNVRSSLERNMPNFQISSGNTGIKFDYTPGTKAATWGASKGWSSIKTASAALKGLAKNQPRIRTGVDAMKTLSQNVLQETNGIIDTSLRLTAPSFSIKPGSFAYSSGSSAPRASPTGTKNGSVLQSAQTILDTSLRLTAPSFSAKPGSFAYSAGSTAPRASRTGPTGMLETTRNLTQPNLKVSPEGVNYSAGTTR